MCLAVRGRTNQYARAFFRVGVRSSRPAARSVAGRDHYVPVIAWSMAQRPVVARVQFTVELDQSEMKRKGRPSNHRRAAWWAAFTFEEVIG